MGTTTHFLICTLWAIASAGTAWYCAIVTREITYVTLADGRKQERTIPILFRLMLPHTDSLNGIFNRPFFERSRIKITKNLVASGFDGLLTAEEILSLRVLFPVIYGAIWSLLIYMLVSSFSPESFVVKLKGLLFFIGPAIMFVYPSMWLRTVRAERHKSIQRSMPFVLDLLTLSVEAGMDFMSALQRNIERRTIDPFSEELITVIREIQLGKTRREALKDMSIRVDLQELRSVVNALCQADELGVSIGAILRIQADQIRQRRFERAEKKANEAPVKMLFPLLFFIFPAVLGILAAPMLYQMLQST